MDTRTSIESIVYHGKILDGYAGHSTSVVIIGVVIVDVGTQFRIYHRHGFFTTPKNTWHTFKS